MKLRSMLAASAVALTLSACSTMSPAVYAPDADTTVELRKIENAKLYVASLQEAKKFDTGCRMMGPVKASEGRSMAQFIVDSFNDEFKFGGVHGEGEGAVKLDGTVDNIYFSSMSGLTGGYWDIALTLRNMDTDFTMQSSVHHEFKSGFDAITACNQTAQNLTRAVQKLISSTVSSPDFEKLIGGTVVAKSE